ncbi:ABC transporter ATP-binding protein [Vallitalea longa]|uniref:ABC transporter ATP-binding protein n=1 Tax=Vallitalea longa TaxID=2936439 RepID=A0A9W5YG30_9FIRM|nr:ATP-binding cassette domain-containing protein [Vallitalea longa]GKX32156.1 ABC transporter ATP-binding protein [Vallitalea longa]
MNIKIEKLYKSYKKNNMKLEVIKDFNHEFQESKIYLIKGQSGKGKSTLLSLIALLHKEDSGKIYFGDTLVSEMSLEEKCKMRREHMGIVFQDYNLLGGLNVIDNVILTDVCSKNLTKEDAMNKALEVLAMLQIEDKKYAYPRELSGGEQQRVGIARAIIKNPSICIYDEPISNLDEENSKLIINFIDDYCHKNGKVGIISCHTNHFDKCADEIINL